MYLINLFCSLYIPWEEDGKALMGDAKAESNAEDEAAAALTDFGG